jgi:hypothetical protein
LEGRARGWISIKSRILDVGRVNAIMSFSRKINLTAIVHRNAVTPDLGGNARTLFRRFWSTGASNSHHNENSPPNSTAFFRSGGRYLRSTCPTRKRTNALSSSQ